jgi:hypothetical protein
MVALHQEIGDKGIIILLNKAIPTTQTTETNNSNMLMVNHQKNQASAKIA